MSYGVKVEVWGRQALFTRPEFSVERVSYDVPTPSAARGLLESIYWHPGLRYRIDRIHVLNEIAYANVRRNELKSKTSAYLVHAALSGFQEFPFVYRTKDVQRRASLLLTDVRYVIEAHFELTDKASPQDNAGKFKDILRRRLSKGQCYSMPYFGTRECPASFKAYEGERDPQGFYSQTSEVDLGLMLYDMDYSDQANIIPLFYHAMMKHGVIDVRESEVLR